VPDTKPTKHKVIRVREAEGRRISHAYDCGNGWREYPVHVTAPASDRLFNFDVPLGKRKADAILVLDNYGDELVPERIRRQIGCDRLFATTVGIHRKTGEVLHVGFIEDRFEAHHGVSIECAPIVYVGMTFWSFGLNVDERLFVPKSYLRRIDELKNKKRPFLLTIADHAVFNFLTRWASYADLARNIMVDFHFDGARLQVWTDRYREVGNWENVEGHPA